MNFQMIGRGYLVYEMTYSTAQLAWVTLSFMLPQVLFSLLGGALADRLPKKFLMMSAQSMNLVSALVMAYVILSERIEVWHFFVLGVFNGTLLALSMPSRQSIIPEVVGDHQLMNAIALNSAGMNLSRILGPALCGMLIAVFHVEGQVPYVGVGIAYLIIAVLYFLSVSSVAFVHLSGQSQRDSIASVWQDIGEGVRYLVGTRIMRGLVIMGTFPMMFGWPLQNLLPAYSRSILDGGPDDLGILQGAMGVGAIIGTLWLARLGDYDRKGRALFIGTFIWGGAIVLFTFAESLPLAIVFGAFASMFSSSLMALNRTLIQLQSPAEMRGRIMSVDQMAHGLMPLGILPIGFLGDSIGIQRRAPGQRWHTGLDHGGVLLAAAGSVADRHGASRFSRFPRSRRSRRSFARRLGPSGPHEVRAGQAPRTHAS